MPIQRKATGPYKAPNIGPKMGLLPQYLKLEGVLLLSMEQNLRHLHECVGRRALLTSV
jgi:hypothetical protein